MGKLDKTKLIEFVNLGLSDNVIGKTCGITRQAVYSTRKKLGINQTKIRYNVRNEEIKNLHDQGMSVKEISGNFGITVFHIYRIIKKA